MLAPPVRALTWLLAIATLHAALYAAVPGVGFATDDFLWLAEAGEPGTAWQHATSREPFGYLRPAFQLLCFGLRGQFGLTPLPFHLLALAASVAAAALLAAVLWRVTRDGVATALGTALFVVHPANAVVVAWVSSLPTLLASVGVLGAVLAWLRYRAGGRTRWAVLSLLAHAFALSAKEEAVVCVAWIATAEVLLRLRGDAPPASRSAWGAAGAHALLAGAYLGAWMALRPAVALSLAPTAAGDGIRAVLDPFARIAACFFPRDLFRAPYAHVLLVGTAALILRATPRRKRTRLVLAGGAGLALVYLTLLPSSFFLWGFPYDKYQRLLHPALPATALVVAFAARALRAAHPRSHATRIALAIGAATMLVPFAIRSVKVVAGRSDLGVEAGRLLAAVQRHEPLIRDLERAGAPLAVVGYPADWIYPLGPIRAVAPRLDVRVLAAGEQAPGATVLRWDAERAEFVVGP